MKRKPDILWILAFLFGLGVVTTGYAQSLWTNKADAPVEISQQQQQSQQQKPQKPTRH
ncbi:MAG: Uncharacterized protein JWR17_134 [Pseudomonas sp.]|jgi:hypothetical protein|uniref:hypothetical protein n=1 Tax=Pseudomonas sp. TaxID=306 RepID=UPI00261BC78C|nr:hypothetical protein [Pseudomonas sp.]MDB6047388.1 Uncharacterized protein [Pseudomonas sp.]